MDSHSSLDIKKHVRTYIAVFVSLLALTLITVTVSYMHFSIPIAISIALFIATVKGSLVASYFMHLISEKKVLYFTLLFTAFIFAVLITLPLFAHSNQVMIQHVP